MRALVICESAFGGPHDVADLIAEGLRSAMTVRTVPAHVTAADVAHQALTGVDLVVVGAPTHVPGRPAERSRPPAEMLDPDGAERIDVDPAGSARDWLAGLPHSRCAAAAFDTKLDNRWSGHAGWAIARRLRDHGLHLVADPVTFLVDRDDHLVDGEEARARAWGEWLAARAAADRAHAVAR